MTLPGLRDVSAEVEMISTPRADTFEESSEWYGYASHEHFWFQWRFRAIQALIADVGVPRDRPARALDIGCGTGIVRAQFEAATRWDVDGVDLNLPALRSAAPGRGSIRYYDVEERHASFEAAYDVVTLCDVIEHIADTKRFLEAALWHLAPGGWLIVNVPALPALHSRYDDAAGHLRRYTRASLAAELEGLPADVRETRYWGLSMVPLLLARKLWVGRNASADSVLREGFEPPGDAVHAILRAMMRTETRLLARPPLGSSVLLAARRNA